MDRAAWQATVHGVTDIGHDLETETPPPLGITFLPLSYPAGNIVLMHIKYWRLIAVPSFVLLLPQIPIYIWHQLPNTML